MKNYIQPGDVLTLTAPYAVASGAPFLVGSIVAIAATEAAISGSVEGVTSGVFEVPKVTGTAFAVGDKIYWDDTAKNCTKTVGSNKAAGVATEAAISDATTAKVKLNGTV